MSSEAKMPEKKDKNPEEGKSKADLRKERRALQEEQRAKKAAGQTSKPSQNKPQEKPVPNQQKQTIQQEKTSKTVEKEQSQNETNKQSSSETKDFVFETAPVKLKLNRKKDESNENLSSNLNKLKLFHHFEQYKRDYSITEKLSFDNTTIHPEFLKLGLKSAHDIILCSNTRCISFLNAFKHFINDFKSNSNSSKTLSEQLESKLKPNINFLTQCRPLSISQGNAIKEMKQFILHLPNNISESEAKKQLIEEIEKFIDEKILLAADTISKYMLANFDIIISGASYARSKITNQDSILVYGYSNLVVHILIEAKKIFPNIHVIVVDSRPKYRGKFTLEKLIKHDINCSYVLINGISFIMNRVSKVILGAHALLANGYVMGQIGSSQIALVAKAFNVPVVVCCETYKFCEKVQTDALVNNELGNPFDLLKMENKLFENEKSILSQNDSLNENITLLNLTYDVTPPDLISCVVTDMGMLPCTSVPVVLRLKNRDLTIVSTRKAQHESTEDQIEN